MSKPIRYTDANGFEWRVELAKELAADFGLAVADLPEFQSVCEEEERNGYDGWRIVRMKYGVIPMVPALDAPPDLLRVQSLPEIRAALNNISEAQIEEQLGLLTAAWGEYVETHPRKKAEVVKKPKAKKPAVDWVKTEVKTPATNSDQISSSLVVQPPPLQCATIDMDEITADQVSTADQAVAVARALGFSDSTFNLRGRDEIQRDAEIVWFARRALDLRKMFDDPMSSGLARRAIINELVLRRVDDQFMAATPGTEEFDNLQNAKTQAEERYEKQWKQLEEICPDIKATARRQLILPAFSTLLEGLKAWQSRGDHELIDGVFTSMGVQVELRTSLQTPDPRYRPGWVAYMRDAMNPKALSDPKWTSNMPQHLLRVLDDGLRKSVAEAVEKGHWRHTDLEGDGPSSEYPALVPPNEAAVVVIPEPVDPEDDSIPEEVASLDDDE